VTRTVVIGLGNPIMSDDGVGIKVARMVREELGDRDDIFVTEAHSGGLRLMDRMVGFDRAIIVDAMKTGSEKPGTVSLFSISDFVTTKNTVSTHDTDLSTALETGRLCGLHLPKEITIFGIEADDVHTCSEEITTEVAKAVPVAAGRILNCLAGGRIT
jgi:hydrogenase maturation protease